MSPTPRYAKLINPQDARVFRITHIDNVPWILENGLYCQSSDVRDPNFVPIGMAELIRKRETWEVPIPPGGVLADYVPFYFTPFSIMMRNIETGYQGVIERRQEDIVIITARMHQLVEYGLTVRFTDGHAVARAAHETSYYDSLDDLGRIHWPLLQARDFKKDPEHDPGKLVRYAAEALVHQHVPLDAIAGIACHTIRAKAKIDRWVTERSVSVKTAVKPDWYF